MATDTPFMTNNRHPEYHKIDTVFKRDMSHPRKMLLDGDWTHEEFAYLADNPWVFTEKVDGTNIRVCMTEPRTGVATFRGRTDNAHIPTPLLERLQEQFAPVATRDLSRLPTVPITLYGEGYGPKIQPKGSLYRSDPAFVLFDVRVGLWWLRRSDVEDIAHQLGLDIVPIIGTGTLHDAIAWTRRGIRSTWGDFEAEGIVARPATELCRRDGSRVITKIKCRDFQ